MPFVEYRPGVWCLQEIYTRCFLVVGNERALLMDSGLGKEDCLALVREITKLPIIYVNSHSHTDHIGANLSFAENSWAHPNEIPYLTRAIGHNVKYNEATDGHIFDLGGTRLKVLYLPGHTPGSIALLEESGSYLLSADLVSSAFIFLTGNCNIEDYCDSLEKVLAMREVTEETDIYPAHGEPKVGRELLKEALELARAIIGGLEPVRQESIPRDVRLNGESAFQIPRTVHVFTRGERSFFVDAE